MRNKALKATALVAALALGTAFIAAPTFAHGPGGQGGQGGWAGGGMMGHMGGGMMGGHGSGMMGGGGFMGGGYNGDCPLGQKAALGPDLTTESVTKFLKQRLSHINNNHLKVNKVTQTDDKTIVGEIVTKDGSLVTKMQFDRATGRHFPVR